MRFEVLLLIGVVAGVGLFWLRRNLDRLVRNAIVERGSAVLGAAVRVDAVRIEPIGGRGWIKGLVIGNPPGFRTAHALKVDRVELSIDVVSLLRDVVTIRRIEVIAPHLIYEMANKRTNLDALKARLSQTPAPRTGASAPGGDAGAGRRIAIGAFVLRDAKVEASAAFMAGRTVGVGLPDLRLHDVGKARGVTAAEFGRIVAQAIEDRLRSAFSFAAAARSVGRRLARTGAAIRGMFE